ncbi:MULTISPECIES: NAD-dependent epimerase/dehydratase family protein [unclassified Ruegeria]|uniref:NAD-dependent epimerase/dehydratase family protein n=1 Tax=unclassified Ruegeria TaxID=2625375 RepID=UPI001487C7F7|nr:MULTISPECIES: NAD-dependent epimerase/dehydratase family protein [unclassified Ruegeria]NOD78567.1 NAD-dependent epimerase/dehydratase family protein [Ruegeria sp. HKCCD4332]NOD90940.1 NAD-dependent epimerase/dehydratase family protein [Ruegeria sp. HKCCD4318]NOD95220.1 NAD-dependent epimerase/dehydratase family protein [Ruegeria sp. HKCCD4884]NOE16328.1 NAD-dependent epimerase/dehydratase family protein [Ruegeria sp. HKCCD4318-2]NOG11746.1 NAD-dependent epimerase/dehydratase family protein
MDWSSKNVLVTGGCSFIGSHLVESLVKRGAYVRVVDDLSSGIRENIDDVLQSGRVEFAEADLLDPTTAAKAVSDMNVVFHLAATHGGRGYISTHQAACSTNLALDSIMIREAHKAGVEQFTFASSGCVYPTSIQADPSETLYLTEDLVKPPYEADDLYGWAKLMAELSLKAYHEEHGFKCASVRYFTAYGERCPANHAVVAMIGRAFLQQNPFIVWGTGEQIRNWTYVSDIVEGTIRAAERIEDGTAINLGTMERTSVLQAAQMILERTNRDAEIKRDLSKPTGPYNRVADNSLAKTLLDWEPEVSFSDGLDRTIRWYFDSHDREALAQDFEESLTERGLEKPGRQIARAQAS